MYKSSIYICLILTVKQYIKKRQRKKTNQKKNKFSILINHTLSLVC